MKQLYIAILLLCSVSILAQEKATVFGKVTDQTTKEALPFTNVTIKTANNEQVNGGITDDEGRFQFQLPQGNYVLEVEFLGFKRKKIGFLVGRLSDNLNLGNINLEEDTEALDEVVIEAKNEAIARRMDKKTYAIDENISQLGGSVVQAMQNLPGVTTNSDGKILLRGSDRVAVLIDGKQSAITGMGLQENLENIPASAIERIEIINNPSAKFDANASAGIINIILKKEKQKGWNGKVGLITGVGSITEKRANLVENMNNQYRFTPKVNPTFSVNYREDKFNFFANGDVLLFQSVAENIFTERNFGNGQDNIQQQFLENKNQSVSTFRAGADWTPNDNNTFTFSTFYFRKFYNDLGSIPYLNQNTNQQVRLWDYDEDELVQTYTAELRHTYHFNEPGRTLETSASFAFKRKEEGYFFTDTRENQIGSDTTALVADQQIIDLNIDYTKPLRNGKLELGAKYRWSEYPNEIIFSPGLNSILDLNLQGSAEYKENIAAGYANYFFESNLFEIEGGLRTEYAKVDYLVDPQHPVYESDGFDYLAFLPSIRTSYLIDAKHTISAFINRRVDRPEEKNLRVFPSYVDPEILRLGNPSLQPQFTNTLEVGYKLNYHSGSLFMAGYRKEAENILTTILTQIPNTNQFANIDQNAGRGSNSGGELSWSHDFSSKVKMNWNANYYYNVINAFNIVNAYPEDLNFAQEKQSIFTGNIKWNTQFQLPWKLNLQSTFTYLAKDIIPQGEIKERYSFDFGIKRSIQEGKGEIFLNASDVFNTFQLKTVQSGENFSVTSNNLFETQVFRLGYQYRF